MNSHVTLKFTVLIEHDPVQGLWVTYVPSLGQLSTFGETRAEAIAKTEEAILGYLEASRDEGLPFTQGNSPPEILELELVAP